MLSLNYALVNNLAMFHAQLYSKLNDFEMINKRNIPT